ncbi:MAG: glycine zipper 2TM domain-containing protein [Sphingorhabdus sp.]
MRTILSCVLATTILTGCATGNSYDRPAREWRSYDYNRPDPSYGGYDASRYYRETRKQRERRLSERDRIYRGQDGRYYCRHSDGSTGLIVGAIAGGVLGNVIAPGRSETLGTILGAIAGGIVGREIDRDDIKCR